MSTMSHLYDSIEGQVQCRFLSPYTLSTLLIGGQYLFSFTHGKGKAAIRFNNK